MKFKVETKDLGRLKMLYERTSTWFATAAENGLFNNYHDKFKEILNLLKTRK